MSSELAAVILAAGKGVRMGSPLPKVLHPVAGRPMLEYVIDAACGVGASPVVVVAGPFPGVAEVARARGAHVVVQPVPRGTGDAVRWASPVVEGQARHVLVLCGDAPLLGAPVLRSLVRQHVGEGNAVTILTALLEDPAGYGRIVRGEDGRVARIVEEADATPEERALREVNSGAFCFAAVHLFPNLARLSTNNAQGELYLTDVVEMLRRDGHPVGAHCLGLFRAPLGINTPAELLEAERALAGVR